ncbi:MAG: hypothetical protein K5854_01595 [Prevotella sp.]|nr:hypothetical protein [Prevotella sp.]
MSSAGKLWFEIDVHDSVQKKLKVIESSLKNMGGSVDDLNKKLKKNADDNLSKYSSTLQAIHDMAKRTKAELDGMGGKRNKLSAALKDNLSNLEKMENALKRVKTSSLINADDFNKLLPKGFAEKMGKFANDLVTAQKRSVDEAEKSAKRLREAIANAMSGAEQDVKGSAERIFQILSKMRKDTITPEKTSKNSKDVTEIERWKTTVDKTTAAYQRLREAMSNAFAKGINVAPYESQLRELSAMMGRLANNKAITSRADNNATLKGANKAAEELEKAANRQAKASQKAAADKEREAKEVERILNREIKAEERAEAQKAKAAERAANQKAKAAERAARQEEAQKNRIINSGNKGMTLDPMMYLDFEKAQKTAAQLLEQILPIEREINKMKSDNRSIVGGSKQELDRIADIKRRISDLQKLADQAKKKFEDGGRKTKDLPEYKNTMKAYADAIGHLQDKISLITQSHNGSRLAHLEPYVHVLKKMYLEAQQAVIGISQLANRQAKLRSEILQSEAAFAKMKAAGTAYIGESQKLTPEAQKLANQLSRQKQELDSINSSLGRAGAQSDNTWKKEQSDLAKVEALLRNLESLRHKASNAMSAGRNYGFDSQQLNNQYRLAQRLIILLHEIRGNMANGGGAMSDNKTPLSSIESSAAKLYYDIRQSTTEMSRFVGEARSAEAAASRLASTVQRMRTTQQGIANKASGLTASDFSFGELRQFAQYRKLMREAENAMNGSRGDKANFMRNNVSNGNIGALERQIRQTVNLAQQRRKAGEAAAEAERRAEAAYGRMASNLERVGGLTKRQAMLVSELGTQMQMAFSIYGIQAFVRGLIQVGGVFEQQHIALQNIIGDAAKANSLFSELQTQAIVSPFTFRELTSYTKQLAAYSEPANSLASTVKELSDLSAGLGVDEQRLILAYGQVRAASVLRGQELRQFTEAGIPLVQKLADEFSKLNGRAVKTSEVFKLISERQVPFEMVQKVLKDMTSEGGQFNNMQLRLSDTLLGKWSNLQDAYEIMLGKIANSKTFVGSMLKSTLSGLTNILNTLNEITPVMLTFVGTRMALSGGKLLGGMTGLGTANLSKNILSAKAEIAAELRKKALKTDLLATEQRILNTTNQITAKDYQQLATAGAFNNKQIVRLAMQGKLNRDVAANLLTQRGVSAELAKQLAMGKGLGASFARLRFGMSGMGSGIMSALGGPWTLGITAAIGGIAQLWSQTDQMEQKINDIGDSALSKANSLNKSIKEISQSTGDATAKAQQYLSTIDENAVNKDEIHAKADSIKNKDERVKYLEQQAKYAEEAQRYVAENNQVLARMQAETGGLDTTRGFWAGVGSFFTGDWLTDSLAQDIEQYRESLADVKENMAKAMPIMGDIEALIEEKTSKDANLEKYIGNKRGQDALSAYLKYISANAEKNNKDLQTAIKSGNHSGMVLEYQKAYQAGLQETIDLLRANENTQKYADELVKLTFNQATAEMRRHEAMQGATQFAQQALQTAGFKSTDLRKFSKDQQEKARAIIQTVLQQYADIDYETGKKLNPGLKKQFGIEIYTETKLKSDLNNQLDSTLEFIQKAVEKKFGKNLTIPVTILGSWKGDTIDDVAKNIDKSIKGNKTQLTYLQRLLNNASSQEDITDINSQILTARTAIAQAQRAQSIIGKPIDTSKKGSKGNKRDAWLESMKQRISLLDKFTKQYEKLRDTMGKAAAVERMRKSLQSGGAFAGLGAIGIKDASENIGNMRTIYRLLKEHANTTDRKREATEMLAKIQDAAFDKEIKHMEALNKREKENIDLAKERWDMQKKWLSATGDDILSKIVSMGYVSSWNNRGEELKYRIQKNPDFQKSGLSVESAANLTDDKLLDIFGKEGSRSDALIEQIKAFREETKSVNKEIADSMQKIYESNASPEVKKANVMNQYADRLDWINKIANSAFANNEAYFKEGKYTPEEKKAADDKVQNIINNLIEALENWRVKSNAKINWEAFKSTDEYQNIFKDMNKIPVGQLKTMLTKTRDLAQPTTDGTGGISGDPETLKAWYDALEKLIEAIKSRQNPFELLSTSMKQKSARKDMLNDNSLWRTDKQGRLFHTFGTSEQETKLANQTGYNKGQTVYKNEVEQNARENENDTDNATKKLIDNFSQLADSLSPIIDMFDQLGASGIGKGVSMAQGALGAASKAQSGINALKGLGGEKSGLTKALGNAGPYAAAAMGALSLASSFFGKHDKKMDKQIRQAEERNKLLKNLTTMIEKEFKYNMGGVYTYKASTAQVQELTKYQQRRNIFGRDAGYVYSHISSDTHDAIAEAQRNGFDYYDTQRAALLAQRDEIAKQKQAELGKKKTDQNKVKQYEQQIEDLQLQIKKLAQDMAKNLYDIDYKSWASQLAQTLVNAWASGANAAKAYRDKVQEIVKQTATSMVAQKVLESQLNAPMEKFMKKFEDAKGRLDVNMMVNQADELVDVMDSATTGVYTIMNALNEQLKKKGLNLKNMSASTLGESIKNTITEETASLVASYLNGIRADVSYKRELEQRLMDELLPNITNKFAKHLSTLQQIEANTGRNANAAEEIRDILRSVRVSSSGGYKVRIA